MATIEGIDLSITGSPSLVMRDLSEYATLPFLAAFDVPAQPKSQTPPKRITYIAISKRTMPMLVDLFLRFKDQIEVYVDGTLEAVLSVTMSRCMIGLLIVEKVASRHIQYPSSSNTNVRHLRNSARTRRYGRRLQAVFCESSRNVPIR